MLTAAVPPTERYESPSVEFLVNEDDERLDGGGRLTRLPALLRLPGSIVSIALGLLVLGAVAAIVSPFLVELHFQVARNATYSVDGFGKYRLVGEGSSRVAQAGHAPALGAVALVAGVLLAGAAAMFVLVERSRGLTTAVASVASGTIAGVFACETVEAFGFGQPAWQVGWWVLALGAFLTVVASGVLAVRTCGSTALRAAHRP